MNLTPKLAPQEKHDPKRQSIMRDYANLTAQNLSSKTGIIGVVLSGSTARGPVGQSSDLDMHVIVSSGFVGEIPEWTFREDGIIENLHLLREEELLCGWSALDKPDELAAWFYRTKLGDELNQFVSLWWSSSTEWREKLPVLIEARQNTNISQKVSCLYNDAARANIVLAEKACEETAPLDGHHYLRLAFQSTLTAILIQRGWTIRGSKKRIEIAKAFLPDAEIKILLAIGLEIVGLKSLTPDRATEICNERLKFRQTLLQELFDLRTRYSHNKSISIRLDQAIRIQEAHEAMAFDYYSPLIREDIIYGPINHIRCLSGMMRVPQLFVSCLSSDKNIWNISEFIKSIALSSKVRDEWLSIMDLDSSKERCIRLITELSNFIEHQNVGKKALPSSYDISRVKMTETHQKASNRSAEHGNPEIHLESFDFLKLKKQTEEKIIFFQDKDFDGSMSVAEKILRIATSRKYRAGPINLINLKEHKEGMIAKFQHHINRNEPIQFMLPAFPFKVRNPLKSSRTAADLAEVASFCKINEINLQICKVYGPGAEFHIFHDGHLYYRHFLNTKEDADVYFQSLKEYTNALQLEKVIILKDVSRELLKFKNFPEVCKDARKEMKNLWDAEKDSNERVLAIRRASCSNVNLSDISEDVLHEISVSPSNNLSERSKLISVEITRRADRCAFEYMIIQHSLERLSFFTSSLPNGVRMTVHPKEGQVGIFLVKRTTFLLPWMGVGVMKKNGEMSVRYECEVKHNKQFTSVFVGADTSPFYYLEN